ncbi:hypothetical protein [Ureibacillus acetophenoni]|uniref:Uncharacterized protein n=1 Tax=Ureibacillus acetophenoni TaxID=614649 RepID=A0A285UH59_9BACL|nr:hypothetical protein [Ureibacillus acetophenoni]SOC41220.1 hypothetical protein SAMN05877842_109133 [Ureibacillus acetophenoni]
MNFIAMYSGFLYFPEDKSAYIPAIIEFLIMIILCVFVFRLIKRISKKQAIKAKELEDRIMREKQQNLENRMQE